MSVKGKIILDLCGGSGSWSDPYRRAGYDVRLVTLPEHDVRFYARGVGRDLSDRSFSEPIHGVLAAPPCTEFAVSGARWWASKPPEKLAEALEVLHACRRIIDASRPAWWALENPPGRCLRTILGPPLLAFDPCDYGDGYTKRTLVWGRFKVPAFTAKRGDAPLGSKMHKMPPSADRAALRSVTPPGFAEAFFRANP